MSATASPRGMALRAALRTALPTHLKGAKGDAMCRTGEKKERRTRAAPAGPTKSHDGTAPSRRSPGGERGRHCFRRNTTDLTDRVWSVCEKQDHAHAWCQIVNGYDLTRSSSGNSLRC